MSQYIHALSIGFILSPITIASFALEPTQDDGAGNVVYPQTAQIDLIGVFLASCDWDII